MQQLERIEGKEKLRGAKCFVSRAYYGVLGYMTGCESDENPE